MTDLNGARDALVASLVGGDVAMRGRVPAVDRSRYHLSGRLRRVRRERRSGGVPLAPGLSRSDLGPGADDWLIGQLAVECVEPPGQPSVTARLDGRTGPLGTITPTARIVTAGTARLP